tara:strand:- start:41 stop:637 length:597 start_codon:yes stop_codon:yes gene_type:complete
MVTATSPLSRQPTKLDYASPTQFRFGINQLPKVEFFTTSANLPGITAGVATLPTPFKNIPTMGDKLEYENLSISFMVDEYLENYTSLHNWMTGIGFPKDRKQFSKFRDITSNVGEGLRLAPKDDVGRVDDSTTSDRFMYSDGFLMLLSNKNNPIVEVRFRNIFPITLSALEFTQSATDVEYLTATADFAYEIYEIITI